MPGVSFPKREKAELRIGSPQLHLPTTPASSHPSSIVTRHSRGRGRTGGVSTKLGAGRRFAPLSLLAKPCPPSPRPQTPSPATAHHAPTVPMFPSLGKSRFSNSSKIRGEGQESPANATGARFRAPVSISEAPQREGLERTSWPPRLPSLPDPGIG